MTKLNRFLATNQPREGSWSPIAHHNLLILVGVTGVGKSTTADALQQTDHTFTPLPNRRIFTDQLIIATLQTSDGHPISKIKDRALRFEYTRRYREENPGGMAHALAQLWISSGEFTHKPNSWLLFDGLRGEDEVHHAAKLLPRAKFLVLDAPHFVRVQRLLDRDDTFDTIRSATSLAKSTADILADSGDLFTADQKAELTELVTHEGITVEQLQSKINIVLAERQNYDPAATIAALQQQAPTRTFVADTVALRPTAIANHTTKTLLSTSTG